MHVVFRCASMVPRRHHHRTAANASDSSPSPRSVPRMGRYCNTTGAITIRHGEHDGSINGESNSGVPSDMNHHRGESILPVHIRRRCRRLRDNTHTTHAYTVSTQRASTPRILSEACNSGVYHIAQAQFHGKHHPVAQFLVSLQLFDVFETFQMQEENLWGLLDTHAV